MKTNFEQKIQLENGLLSVGTLAKQEASSERYGHSLAVRTQDCVKFTKSLFTDGIGLT